MKTIIYLFILFLASDFCYAQHHFKINSVVGDSVFIKINGDSLNLNSEYKLAQTNFPKFDTLLFLNNGAIYKEIICNFKPDTNYSVSRACCSSLDIIPSSKLKNDSLQLWDYEEDLSKIQNVLMDRPFISMKIVNCSNDTIYGWYVDLACFAEIKKLEEQKWDYGVPMKCFYWTNISTFLFFKSKIDYVSQYNENGIYENYPEYEDIKILGDISVRLFDNESFILTFDCETNKVSIEYD